MRWFLAFLAVLAVSGAAHAAPPPLEVYGALPGVEAIQLSPSGQSYAIATFDGTRRLVVVIGPDGKLLRGADVGRDKIWRLEWAGEDRVLITTSRAAYAAAIFTGPVDVSSVFSLNVKAGTLTPMLSVGLAANGIWGDYGAAEIDGKWYGFYAGLTAKDASLESRFLTSYNPDLYQVDLDTGRGRMFQRSVDEDFRRAWVVDSHGKLVGRSDYNNVNGVWRLDAGGRRTVERRDLLAESTLIGMGRTEGSLLFILRDKDGDRVFELAAGAAEPVELADMPSTDGLLMDRRTGLFIGYFVDGEQAAYTLFSPAHQARVRAAQKAFPALKSTLVSYSADFNRMIMFTEGDNDSGTYWLVDIPTGDARAIGANYPKIPEAEVADVKVFTYAAADGLKIEGLLTLPHGREARNLPVIVMPHGGPEGRDIKGFDWLAQAFAARGYAVFQPNFRGSTGQGFAFLHAARGEWGGKMQTDISDGLAFLAAQGTVDAKRACILGASYGGYAALAGVTLQQGLYRCAVSYGGLFNLVGVAGHAGAMRRVWDDQIGPLSAQEARSLTRLASRADAPVLLIHGKDDSVVEIDQSQAMLAALRNARKPVDMITLNSADHWLTSSETRTAMLKAAVAFVEQHNPAN